MSFVEKKFITISNGAKIRTVREDRKNTLVSLSLPERKRKKEVLLSFRRERKNISKKKKKSVLTLGK
jgi:hypothetical protein